MGIGLGRIQDIFGIAAARLSGTCGHHTVSDYRELLSIYNGICLHEQDLCCAVVRSEASGRSLVAATKLDAGSVVIVEQPFVSVLANSLRTKARRP